MLKKKIMAYVHQLLDQPSQWITSQQAGPCSVPKFTNTSITVKHLLIKNKNINQSKSSLLIWHYVSYLFLFTMKMSKFCSCFNGLFLIVEFLWRKHLPAKCHSKWVLIARVVWIVRFEKIPVLKARYFAKFRWRRFSVRCPVKATSSVISGISANSFFIFVLISEWKLFLKNKWALKSLKRCERN